MEEPFIVAFHEKLMSDSVRRLWLHGYTTIESNMVQEDGTRGLALEMKKNTGHTMSEIKSYWNFFTNPFQGQTEYRGLWLFWL